MAERSDQTGASPSTSAARSPMSCCSTAPAGTVVVDKTLTTPAAPLDGGAPRRRSAAGARPASTPPTSQAPIVHATTLVTNALIEGKTGRAGLVTTDGFGDTLLIRNEHRYDMYDLQIEFPAPPIPRALHVRARRAHDRRRRGAAARPTPADARRAWPPSWRRARVEAVAVCFLHAYANPANERIVAEPPARARSACRCASSSEVSPQIREYPRMVTTACNAATMPVIGPYLDEFQTLAVATRASAVGC